MGVSRPNAASSKVRVASTDERVWDACLVERIMRVVADQFAEKPSNQPNESAGRSWFVCYGVIYSGVGN
jgi:hypothetical protein